MKHIYFEDDRNCPEKIREYSDEEILEIDNLLIKYVSKKIHLREVLAYLKIEYFLDHLYEHCSKNFMKLVTPEEASVFCIIQSYLMEFLEHPDFVQWKQLYDYVVFVRDKDTQHGTAPMCMCLYQKVSEIDWSTYDQSRRPISLEF